ncbi:hypothetical protein SORBI_3006G145650 [Sorghum bicolor]|uniref:Uncharacterized protein n=1 Tax=Sorghum bicolor TaxID=4558 RepID=A0A1Z5RDX8_SORBI|nr:hypothetical protein SORBI_3006G145650 [Sorghum bicolor]
MASRSISRRVTMSWTWSTCVPRTCTRRRRRGGGGKRGGRTTAATTTDSTGAAVALLPSWWARIKRLVNAVVDARENVTGSATGRARERARRRPPSRLLLRHLLRHGIFTLAVHNDRSTGSHRLREGRARVNGNLNLSGAMLSSAVAGGASMYLWLSQDDEQCLTQAALRH